MTYTITKRYETRPSKNKVYEFNTLEMALESLSMSEQVYKMAGCIVTDRADDKLVVLDLSNSETITFQLY